MFEHYLVGRKPNWARRALIIVSISVHALGGIALFVYSTFHVEEITPPAITLTFFSAPPPPPPPPPPAGRKRAEPKPKPKVVQPASEIPKLVQPPMPEEPEEEEGEEGGVPGGVPGGVVGGVAGGVVGGVLGAPQPPPPKMVPSFILDGQRISSPDPHLPNSIGVPGQSLRATYRICVGTNGRVTSVEVMAGIPGGDQAVTEHIRSNWIYKPQPLPVCSIRNFIFMIR
jgi:protein TonB